MIYTKWSNPIGCYTLAKNCDWFRQITPLSNLIQVSLLVEWKLTAKEELNSKSTILKENAGKVESVFVIRSAQWAEKLGCCLEYCPSWKNTLGKLAIAVNLEAIRFDSSFERKGALVTMKICVLCGRWFSNQFEIVSETPFSCDAVGRELFFARCCAVNWTGTYSHRKARLCVYLTLRSDVLIFRIPKHQSVCQEFFATEKSWIH